MVFYEFKIGYRDKATRKQMTEVETEETWLTDCCQANSHMGTDVDPEKNVALLIVDGERENIKVLAGFKLENKPLEECKDFMLARLKRELAKTDDYHIVEEKEIPAGSVDIACKYAVDKGYVSKRNKWFANDLKVNYFENMQFHVKETQYGEKTYEESVKQANLAMADESVMQELERIYADTNARKFYGHPVHYKLTVGSSEAAKDIVDILVPALCANKRMLGHRLEHIYDVEDGCYHENDLDNLFSSAQGNAIIIELKGSSMDENYETDYERVVSNFDHLINQYSLNTLFIFVDVISKPGFSQKMISRVEDYLNLVELKEGAGSFESAVSYLRDMIDKTDLKVSDKEVREILPKKKLFTVSEVYGLYKKWYEKRLREKIYPSYQSCKLLEVPKKEEKSEPYKELQEMIGLTEVKNVVDQVIAAGKIGTIRSKMGLDNERPSLHMIFQGNPGSAKTTVARLLSQILRKEGVIECGNVVEVGRSDLIAKYVGWTAKTVRQKFREASGGILFIDEAYSLVDDSKSFGDEAINTIVQEMENHREDVIVVFAGYPNKMKEFLDKNEGLRSRIAFHLNFVDYKAEELWNILKLMAKRKGYKLSEDVYEKCMPIFKEACTHEEFGNGRFVRNLLEQALMNQSKRLYAGLKGKTISKRKLTTLIAADFDNNASSQYKEKKNKFGFAV